MRRATTALILALFVATPFTSASAESVAPPETFSALATEAKCNPAIAADTAFQVRVKESFRALIKAEEKDRLRPEIHEEDAKLMLTNKRHVVMAYAAIMTIFVVFIVMLFRRQQRLVAEIASLRGDLETAIKD